MDKQPDDQVAGENLDAADTADASEAEAAARYERHRKMVLWRRIILIGGGVLVFIVGNWIANGWNF